MTQSRYDGDRGETVLGSFSDLLVALNVKTMEELEEWADALVEPYVTLEVVARSELVVSLDGGFSAALEYPFSLEFLVETITDLEHDLEAHISWG